MSIFWFIALVNLLLVATVIATSPLQGLSRLLSPDTQLVVTVFAIFSIRPLFGQRFQPSEDIYYRGFYGFVPTREGQMMASLVGVLLLVGITIGALLFSTAKISRVPKSDLSPIPSQDEANSNSEKLPYVRALIGTVVALAIYFATMVAYLGVDRVLAMSRGRSTTSVPQGLPEIVGVVPLAGSIAAATIILMARCKPIAFGAWMSIMCCTAMSLVTVAQLGARRFMIPSVLIVLTAMLMRKSVKLRPWHLATAFSAVVILAIIPYVRSEGNRHGRNLVEAIAHFFGDVGLFRSLRNIFTTYDTEMYDYIAVLAPRLASGRAEYGFGAGTLLEFITHPLPAGVLENVERSNEIRSYIFNYSCGTSCGLPFPVPSLGGVLFFDGWYAGVIFGGILAGVVTRSLALRWFRAETNTVAQNVFTAVFVSYVGIAARTETVYVIWHALYTAIIAAAVLVTLGQKIFPSGMNTSKSTGYASSTRGTGPRNSWPS